MQPIHSALTYYILSLAWLKGTSGISVEIKKNIKLQKYFNTSTVNRNNFIS